MRKRIVCNIISVNGFYSGPNDDVSRRRLVGGRTPVDAVRTIGV